MADSLSGMSEEGAKEFHSLFVTGFMVFTAVAVVAHFLVWMWRPWFPSVDGYKDSAVHPELMDSVASTVTSLLPFIA